MSISIQSRRSEILAIVVLLIAFALRLFEASQTYLNPDEALIFFTAQSSEWYERSLQYHHPPFFFLLLHGLQFISNSELCLRLISAFAGCLFPWVIWKWLVRLNFPDVALVTFLMLEFSPNMISLSAQVRGYTLMLLLAALALFYLEEALETKDLRALLISSFCLYLAILTEYSAVFAVGALGTYALIRLVANPRPIRFSITWAFTQIGALGVYGILYKASIATLLANPAKEELVRGYLSTAFPQPAQDLFIFSIAGTFKQFAYLCSSLYLGYPGFVLFVAGLCFLWSARTTNVQYRNRALVIAFSTAFCLALGGALLQLHPFGRSRHTAILTLFSAPGIAFGFEWLFRRFPKLSIPVAVLFAGACYLFATPDFSNIPKAQQMLPNMVQAIEQLKAQVAPEALILSDEETTWMLNYYLGNRHQTSSRSYSNGMQEIRISTYRILHFRWDHESSNQIHSDLVSLRKALGVPTFQPVWVLDGGFYILPPGSVAPAHFLSNTLLLIPAE